MAVECRAMWDCGVVRLLTFCLCVCVVTSQHRGGRIRDLSAAFELLEESQPQSFVGDVVAGAGLDWIYNSTILSSLEFGFIRQSGHNTDYFRVEADTGILRTFMPIDRDERCPGRVDCVIDIVVAILKPVDFFQAISVAITLLDRNDNAPTFTPSVYSIKFSESDPVRTSRSLPIALDMDSPRFGVHDYTMTTQTREFELQKTVNSGSGLTELKLVLAEPLDRELVDTYMLRVVCVDGGSPPRNGTLLIDIAVEDDNDHSPIFEQDSYSIEVSEAISVNVTFFTVHAVDPDADENGHVEYVFSPVTASLHGDQFRLDKDTGQLSLKRRLDYESTKSFHLEIVARDRAPNARSALTQIALSVIDINDNFPEITISTLTDKLDAEIKENLPADSSEFIAYVSVFDADIGENGNVECGLSHPSFTLIVISQDQYKIVTEESLDREAVSSYILKVECYDMGKPSLSSSKDLTVNVLDDNDHSPIFHPSQYSEALREGNMMDAYILRVMANDSDIGPNADLRYSIMEAGVSKYVYIQEVSGNIRAAKQLDYEQIQQIEFTVVARDQGTPQRSATAFVRIIIIDINDEVPRFNYPQYSFSLPENEGINKFVGQVSAFDLDSPPYNEFEFDLSMRHHENMGTFDIDAKSGEIFAMMSFDREETAVYYMTVFAYDTDNQGLVGSASVTVNIEDVNDNSPRITSPEGHNRTFEVSAYVPLTYNITKVSATDQDFGDNALLKFDILSGDDQGLFVIDDSTGLISVVKELKDIDYERYWLTIIASDSGVPPKVDRVDILIIVDNAIPYYPPDSLEQGLVRQSNLMVIIIVAAVSGFIIVILIIAIVLLKGLDRRRFHGKEYNCRTEEQKILNDLNLKAVEANGNLHAKERLHESSLGNISPSTDLRGSGTLSRKTERGPPPLGSTTTLGLGDMGCPHTVRNAQGEEVPPPPCPPLPGEAGGPGHDRHLEAHLMALLKQDQDGDSASSADMSNADSGRGASEEGEGGPRYGMSRPSDHLHGVPSNIPGPPNPPHGYQQPRYTQPPVRITIKPEGRSTSPGHLYAHGHSAANSPGSKSGTSTFQPLRGKASSEVDVHKPGAAYKMLGTVETRASLQSLPSYSHSRSPSGGKHVTFIGNGSGGGDGSMQAQPHPSGYQTTGGHMRHHPKGQPYSSAKCSPIDSNSKSHNVDSSGYGTVRPSTHVSHAAPKEEVWQYRKRHRDHPLRDITEEDDNSRGADDDKVDSAKLCQQIDDIFFKQKSVVV